MKYIIYGINRVAKDFLYIFEELDILYVADDSILSDSFCGYRTKSIEEALADSSYDRIILCDFDKVVKEKRLWEHGLMYGREYLYEEDFFDELDEFRLPDDRKLAVWGTGTVAAEWTGQRFSPVADAFIETRRTKDEFMGCPVLMPEEIGNWKEWFVVIAVAKDDDIRSVLLDKGLKEYEDFVNCQKLTGMPSSMLCRTIFDDGYYDLDCRTMLNHLEIFHGGNTRCCCTTFVRQNLDSIFEKDAGELWHSKLHKIMCLSTENRTYSFCDKTMCPLFVAKKRMDVTDEYAGKDTRERGYRQMTDRPEVLALGHDSSCNLSCGTCRREVHFAKGNELEQVNRITDKIREEYLPNCRFLILAGDGEVFASPAYRSIYESGRCDPAYIRLLSNGTLFTPERWAEFSRGKSGKIMLTVSVDAATKQTYEKIRRNGNFDRLSKNMKFAADLRKRGELCYFRMNFVVQRANYKEMPLFVRWGEKLGTDEVFFTKILNWGTYTKEEFARVSMMEADGITPKAELKEVLEDPAMHSGIVDLGTIQYSHRADETAVVENYYMWELEKRGGVLFT